VWLHWEVENDKRHRLPQERLSMRKIKEVLRLHTLGLRQRQIARSSAIGQSTVSDYLKWAETAGLHWPSIGMSPMSRGCSPLWVRTPRSSEPGAAYPHPTLPICTPNCSCTSAEADCDLAS
jgi:hypothetical protein